jgi:hypothetical protein
MPQNFSNLSQRRSLSKHLAGETMTELMGSLPRQWISSLCRH